MHGLLYKSGFGMGLSVLHNLFAASPTRAINRRMQSIYPK